MHRTQLSYAAGVVRSAGIAVVIMSLSIGFTIWAKPPTREQPQRAAQVQQETEVVNVADSRWVSTTGDLSAAASYSPSGVPVANGSIYFDGSSQFDVVSGLTAFTGIDLTRIWTQAPYQGNIGANGNPLLTGVKYLIHNGSGSLILRLEDHALHTDIIVDSPNIQDAFRLENSASALLNVYLLRGGSSISGTIAAIDNLYVCPSALSQQLNVTIDATFTSQTRYYQNGGLVTTTVPLGTASGDCVVSGGLLIYDLSATGAWGRIIVTSGGRFEYDGTGALSRCLVESGGVLDMLQDSRAKTITSLVLMPGSTFLTHANITVTTLVDLRDSYPILP